MSVHLYAGAGFWQLLVEVYMEELGGCIMTDPHGSFDGWVKMAEYLQRTLDGAPASVKGLVSIPGDRVEKSSRLEALRVKSVELEKALEFTGESRVFLPDFTGIDPLDWKMSAYFSPLMCEDGGIPVGYAHFISGLMLNKIIPRMAHRDVMFNVLCLGRGLLVDEGKRGWINNTRVNEDHEKLDQICGDIFRNLKESAAFRDVIKKPSAETKHVHRTVLWLSRYSHAFAIGWEVSSDGCGSVFVLDCMPPDKFIHKLVDVFTTELEIVYQDTVNFEVCFDSIPYSLIGTGDAPIAADFVCVPFMARSTLYISTMPSLFRDLDFSGFVKHIGLDLERKLYAHFEHRHLKFIDDVCEEGNCLWFSDMFYHQTILNINDIGFDVVSRSAVGKGKIVTSKYFFDGFKKGFAQASGGDQSCAWQGGGGVEMEESAGSSGVNKDQEVSMVDYEKEIREKNPDLFEKWKSYIDSTRAFYSSGDAEISSILHSSLFYNETYNSLLKNAMANNMKLLGGPIANELKPHELGSSPAAQQGKAVEYGWIEKSESIRGYDFLVGPPLTIPCMSAFGGFSPRYGHVLPALMLAGFLQKSSAKNVQTVHICQGYGIPLDKMWWKSDNDIDYGSIADMLISSEAFQSGLQCMQPSIEKKIRRMCIWLSCIGHVFLIVWECGAAHDVLYYADNHAKNDFRKRFMPVFSDKIISYRMSKHLKNRFDKSVMSQDDVKLTPHLMCVSFMARSTAYLNSIDSFLDSASKQVIGETVTTVDARICYLLFEKALFTFLNEKIHSGKCVWLPAVMQEPFVNIDDVCLNEIIPGTDKVTSYIFGGVGYGFLDRETVLGLSRCGVAHSKGDELTCNIQSKFQCFNTRPTHLSTLPLRSAVSLLKECRELLSRTSSTMRWSI